MVPRESNGQQTASAQLSLEDEEEREGDRKQNTGQRKRQLRELPELCFNVCLSVCLPRRREREGGRFG